MMHSGSRFLSRLVILILLLASSLIPASVDAGPWIDDDQAPASVPQHQALDEATQARVLETYSNLPLVFIANQGQTDAQVGFMVRGATHEPTHAPLSATTQSLPVGEFPITTNPANQYDPAISGDIVVWADNRNGNTDIYAYDLSTQREFRITNDTSRPSSLDISDRVVVWYDGRVDAQGIYGYNLSTGHEFPVNTDSNASYAAYMGGPAISGDVVVWSSKFNIRGFNLSTQSSFVIPDVTSLGYEYNPDVFGDVVVWETGFSNPTRRDIHGFDLSTQTEFSITSDFGNTNQMNPAIWNNIVVWQDNRHGNWDIYGYDLSSQTEFRITDDPADQVSPTVSGRIVLWQDARNGGWDLYGYDLDRQIEFPVRTFPADQLSPAIADNIVVWEDWRNRNGDIYAQQFEYPVLALQVEPLLLLFDVNDTAIEPAVQEVEISTVGDSSIEWTATPKTDWLNIAPVSGATPALMNVSIDVSNLHGGSYPWQIIIAGTDGKILNTPQSVVVDFLGTEVSGTIDADTTWNVAGSPYTVVGDVTISEGVMLTIEPGAGLRFESNDALSSGVDPDKVELIVAGTLVADGVTFTSDAGSPASGDWYGIRFLDGSADWDGSGGSVIRNSIIEYGTVGVSTEGASPLIATNTIRYMKGRDGDSSNVMDPNECPEVNGGSGYGIHISGEASPEIIDNIIVDIRGGIGGVCRFYPYGRRYGKGGDAVAIFSGAKSSPRIVNNVLSIIDAGAPGGLGAGVYLGGSSANIYQNQISLVTGGGGASAGYDGGIGAGVYILDGSSLTIDSNMISFISGGTGAAGWTEGFCRVGRRTGDGGIGAGIYATNNSSLDIANNLISEITGGKGGRGNPGCYAAPPDPGGRGANGVGIHVVNSSLLNITNNIIFALQGGNGGEGVPSPYAEYPSSSGGDGGVAVGIYAKASLAALMNNTVASSIGGWGGAPGDPNKTQLERVGDSTDDAREFADGNYDDSGPAVLLGDYYGTQDYVGLRFTGVWIPQGAVIDSAALTLTAYDNRSGTTNFLIKGEAVGDSPTFSADNSPRDRTPTAAGVIWTVTEAWVQGQTYSSPDLAAVIQEIVNREDWHLGSALTILVLDVAVDNQNRSVSTYDKNSDEAAELTIAWHWPEEVSGTRGEDGKGIGIDVNSSVDIVNNIVVSHMIGISGTTTTAILSHNDVWSNSEANYSGVAPGTNDISADPLFVDPANNDYHLQAGSPCIDAGTNEGAPPTDFEGDPRPLDGNSDGIAVVDMGADEFKPSPAPPIPVGGIIVPVSKLELLAAWICLGLLVLVAGILLGRRHIAEQGGSR